MITVPVISNPKVITDNSIEIEKILAMCVCVCVCLSHTNDNQKTKRDVWQHKPNYWFLKS